LKCESKKAPDIGGLLAVVAMDFFSGPPMQFLSGVDKVEDGRIVKIFESS
jgi:hypothetical protein